MAKNRKNSGTVETTTTAVAKVTELSAATVDGHWLLPANRAVAAGVSAPLAEWSIRRDKEGRPIGVIRKKEFGEEMSAKLGMEFKGASLTRAHHRLVDEFSRHAGPALVALYQSAGGNLKVNRLDIRDDKSGNLRVATRCVIVRDTDKWQTEKPAEASRKAVVLRQENEKLAADNAKLLARLAELEKAIGPASATPATPAK